MFRKHFRFKRLVLGFAFAALTVPTASAFGASNAIFVDGMAAPRSVATVSSYTPSYLRYHEVGFPVGTGPQIRSEHARSVSTITPLQADGLRWTGLARHYQQLQATQAISERSNGVKGPDPSLVPQLAVSTSDGFNWKDAGIGASSMFGAALLLAIGFTLIRRNQRTGLTHA